MTDIPVTSLSGGRGLLRFGEPVVTDYGHEVRIQTSSSAEKDAAWMFIDYANAQTELADDHLGVHMTIEQATALRDRLTAWIEYFEPETP